MIESGHVRPIVGRRYAFDDAAQALRDLADRRGLGKLVLDVT